MKWKFFKKVSTDSCFNKECSSEINKKFKVTGSVFNAKRNYKKTVRLQKNINCVKDTMTRSLQKSTGRLSCQLSIKRTPCQRMLKYMKMRAFKLTTL